jgi:galactokinase
MALAYSDFDLAQLAHRAENAFVGIPVGVMDPMACSLAGPKSALFLNTRTLEHENVAFPPQFELAVIDSGQRHEHASGEYGSRRTECEEAARALGVKLLCDFEHVANRADRIAALALSPKLRARVSHVFSENQRVAAAVEALRRADGEALGRLLTASHTSLRDEFEVSTPEIDALVEVATTIPGCLGARITGGGFGGSIVMLTRNADAARVASETLENYALRVPHLTPSIVPFSPSGSNA